MLDNTGRKVFPGDLVMHSSGVGKVIDFAGPRRDLVVTDTGMTAPTSTVTVIQLRSADDDAEATSPIDAR